MSIDARFRLSYRDFDLDADLHLPGSGVTALFGHSGSGKTTLLRLVAGLERVADGRLTVNGDIWQKGGAFLPTHRRPLGYVFQEACLFPHLTARGNLEYGMRRSREAMDPAALGQIIDLLGIGHLLDRKPDQFSGGERQRVAVARALAVKPRLLLMDEPLAALDHQRKKEILPYLVKLRHELSIPILYVTHSMDEVLALADTLVLMSEGKAVAVGAVEDLLSRPDLRPLTGRYEAGAVIQAIIGGHDASYGVSNLIFPGGTLVAGRVDLPVGQRVRVRIHARDVALAVDVPQRISVRNILPCVITSIARGEGHLVDVMLDCGGTPLWSQITLQAQAQLALVPGMKIHALIKAVTIARGDVAGLPL